MCQHFKMLIGLLATFSVYTVSATVGTDHIRSGNTTEQAGLSGTVYVEAACNLTLMYGCKRGHHNHKCERELT